MQTYLQSNLMHEYRLSKIASISCRVPFVDYKLVEMAFSFQTSSKVFNGIEKYPLKMIARNFLPEEVAFRKKQSFINPSNKYSKLSFEYLRSEFENIRNNPYLQQIFTQKFLDSLIKTDLFVSAPELAWKIMCIHRFCIKFGS